MTRAVLVFMLIGLCAASGIASSSFDGAFARPGSIRHTQQLADFQNVVLDAVWVKETTDDWIFVRDPWVKDLLPVYVGKRLEFRYYQALDVAGYTATVSGTRVVVATDLNLYVDAVGRPFRSWIKGLLKPYNWPYLKDIPLNVDVRSAIPAPPEPAGYPASRAPVSPDLPDSPVSYEDLIVTADRDDSTGTFYVEREDRANGIRGVYTWPTTVERGNTVDIEGDMLLGSDTAIVPPSEGWTISVNGISSSASPDENSVIRVVRSRDQADVGLSLPADVTDPTIAITDPPDNTIFLLHGATSTVLAGDADDAESKVVTVDVKIDDDEWESATYDQMSHNWSYVWDYPKAAAITARATDFAGNSATTSRQVDIVSYESNWLTVAAYVTRPDEVQASWTYPNPTTTIEYAVGTAPCRDDVSPWTEAESPSATQATVSDLDLEDETTYCFSVRGLDTGGELDHIGSCPFSVDLGADSLTLAVSPSAAVETGGEVTVTATLTDCRDAVISGRAITFETMGAYDSTTTVTTNAQGKAAVTFSCAEEGWVNVIAREYQPGLANVEDSIDIEFRKPPLIEALFVMEGNVWGFYNDLVCDTIWEMLDLSSSTGIPIKFGGLSFDDLPCNYERTFMNSYDVFNYWLWLLDYSNCCQCERNSVAWEALGTLAQANGTFSAAATHKYVAVISNNKYLRCDEEPSSWYNYCYTPSGCYTKVDVLQIFEESGCRVFVDRWNQTGTTFNDLSVNGAVEIYGSWDFSAMLSAMADDIDEILNPTPPQYEPGACDPLYVVDEEEEEEEEGTAEPLQVIRGNRGARDHLDP